ncbi:hypothetical protein [Halorubrum sp. AS12]|uniref:hypothetical protein n=1 Tax=Halorubrum sp. AS12 TaxID=3409687 RepID=UPI003DA73E6D
MGRVDSVFVSYGYDIWPPIEGIDASVPGYGGFSDLDTFYGEIRSAAETILVVDLSTTPVRRSPRPTTRSSPTSTGTLVGTRDRPGLAPWYGSPTRRAFRLSGRYQYRL